MKFLKVLKEEAIEIANTGNFSKDGQAAISFRVKTLLGKQTDQMGFNDMLRKYPREAKIVDKIRKSSDWINFLSSAGKDDVTSWDIIANAADEIILTADNGAVFKKYKIKEDGSIIPTNKPLTAAEKALIVMKNKGY